MSTTANEVTALAEDTVRPATPFDPQLTYYADGTRVTMRARGAERHGTTTGMAPGLTYAFQVVRWDDGDSDLIAPHVLHRTPVQPTLPGMEQMVPAPRGEQSQEEASDAAAAANPTDLPDGYTQPTLPGF